MTWRVGSKIGRNLYQNDEPVAMLATEEMAQRIADGMNKAAHDGSMEAKLAEANEAHDFTANALASHEMNLLSEDNERLRDELRVLEIDHAACPEHFRRLMACDRRVATLESENAKLREACVTARKEICASQCISAGSDDGMHVLECQQLKAALESK